MMSFGNFYTVRETANILGRSVGTIYNRINSGLFPSIKIKYPSDFHESIILVPKSHVHAVLEHPAGLSPKLKVFVRHVKKGGTPHDYRTL